MSPYGNARLRGLLGLLAAVILLAACGEVSADHQPGRHSAGAPRSSAPGAAAVEGVAMRQPRPLEAPLLSPDVLVFSSRTLPATIVDRIRNLDGVVATERFSMAQFFYQERSVTYAAVDPATFRRYTPTGTAHYTDVWDRVANGEIAVSKGLGKAAEASPGYLRMGNGADAPRIHIGAYADLVPKVDAVLNERWAARLHMQPDNAMVLSTGVTAPESIQKQLLRITRGRASVQVLAHVFDIHVPQTAVLTGGSVAAAVGSFTYTANPDGTVVPDPRWVSAYIRTARVPIIGTVSCNKVMLPQLRAALTEIAQRGLASRIHSYDGCYVPRFIGHDPAQGLSFHTFGTAIDLNASENPRGTPGRIDPTVVAIFEKWGFTWGGTWHYTDPMHFELNRLVSVA
jgi:D-alanyl-D-alanine carboxypeptidase